MQLELGCLSAAVVPLVPDPDACWFVRLRHAQPVVVNCELHQTPAGSEMLQRAEVQRQLGREMQEKRRWLFARCSCSGSVSHLRAFLGSVLSEVSALVVAACSADAPPAQNRPVQCARKI